jgi:hypothetical protein
VILMSSGAQPNKEWGIFSMAIPGLPVTCYLRLMMSACTPGRVGYQCSNFYRRLVKEGERSRAQRSLHDRTHV